MMRWLVRRVVVSVFAALALTPLGWPEDQAKTKYQALLAGVQSGDSTVDFAELRLAFAESPEYTWEPDSTLRKQMYDAFGAKKYSDAIAVAEKALKEDYLDIDAHQVMYLAYKETNDVEKADFHHTIAHGLIQALLGSGDGKTKQTAYTVISVREEYIVLEINELSPGKQSLVRDKNHTYDVLDAVDPKTNNTVTLYFNIDRPMAAEGRIFQKH